MISLRKRGDNRDKENTHFGLVDPLTLVLPSSHLLCVKDGLEA
jgi:hypothetical protein